MKFIENMKTLPTSNNKKVMRSMTYLPRRCRQTDIQIPDTGTIPRTVINVKTLPAMTTSWRGR